MFRLSSGRTGLLAAVLASTLIVTTQANAKVKIQHMAYAGHGQAYLNYLNDRKAAFEAKQSDIEVEIVAASMGGPEYAAKVVVMASAGVPPDVTDVYPAIGGELIAGGIFADLRPYMERDAAMNPRNFIPVSLEFYKGEKGEIFGIPYGVLPLATTYNEDLFNEAGVLTPHAQGANWTWDSAVQSAKRLTRDTNGDGTPDVWGASLRGDLLRVWTFVHQAGGNFFDRTFRPTQSRFNTPAVATGVRYWADFYTIHNAAGPDNGIYKGIVAFTMDEGPWAVGNMETSEATFAWAIGRLPQGPKTAAGIVFGGGYQMPEAGHNKKAAWEWLKFLSSRESQIAYAKFTGRVPALLSAAREYRSLFPKAPASIMMYLDLAQDPQSMSEPVSPVLNTVRSQFNRGLNDVRTGKRSVQDFLAEMHVFATAQLEAARAKK